MCLGHPLLHHLPRGVQVGPLLEGQVDRGQAGHRGRVDAVQPRHAVQQVRRISDQKRDRPPAEFRKIYSAEQTDRNADERRQNHQLQGAQDCIGHSPTDFSHRGGEPCEEIPGKVFSAIPHQIAKNEK